MKPSQRDFKYWTECGIPKKYHSRTLDSFTNDKAALKIVKDYIKSVSVMFSRGTGLYLYGLNGRGKTHLMMSAFKLFIERGYSCKIYQLRDLINMYTETWGDVEKSRDFNTTIRKIQFLGIEEIGKEFKTKNSDLALHVLDTVLRARIQHCKPVWVTSNVSPKNIATDYSVDVASLLKEGALPTQVIGEDYRDTIMDNNLKEL